MIRNPIALILVALLCLVAAIAMSKIAPAETESSRPTGISETTDRASDAVREGGDSVREEQTEKPSPDAECKKPLSRVYQALIALRRSHEDAFQQNDIPERDKLSRKIKQIERQLQLPISPPQSVEPRVHAVGYYRSYDHVAHVKVTDTSSPIVLVLTAYSQMEWAVAVDDEVQIDMIILSGYKKQTICRVPDGVPVFSYAYNSESDGYAYAYGPDRDKWKDTEAFVAERTGGLPISTIFGSYHCPKEPAIIGPANARWRVQMLDEQLRPALNTTKEVSPEQPSKQPSRL